MQNAYYVKGVSSMGRIVELRVKACTADDARQKAVETGLSYIVVKAAPPMEGYSDVTSVSS